MKEQKQEYIYIKGARVNNLKNIDVAIPRGKFVVITGLSGSGKSSLAFDTLYAEGQRRYVESLSSYARQFLGRMSKPEVDYIKGIPPAIAIQQKVNTRNPRSTVGTSTEIYDYLKLLYARIGKTFSPLSGKEVKKHTAEDVVNYIFSLPEGTKAMILAPISPENGRTMNQQLDILQKQGFSRVEIDGEIERISDILSEKLEAKKTIYLVIDRIVTEASDEFRNRVTDSVETAFYEGKNICIIKVFSGEKPVVTTFSNSFSEDGIVFELPSENMFNFNNPLGACPTCEGFGNIIGIDPDLVIPNRALSVYDDAVMCWRGETMGEWKKQLVMNAAKFDFPIHKPIYELTPEQEQLLWEGNQYFGGINAFFKMVENNQYKIQYRVMLSRYRGKTVCPTCKGTRLKPQAGWVKIDGKPITELVDLPITELKTHFENLKLNEQEQAISKRILLEINNRISFLLDVGLGYLTLNRLSNTLSGGESQRINLVTSLGSSLVGSLYILDEPSIGLHSRDTDLLISVLRKLQQLGNTVVVVEHDEEIIRAADYIIDIGPEAGRLGGEVVYAGEVPTENTPQQNGKKSYTLDYLLGKEKIEIPKTRRKWNNYIEVLAATEHNLKAINVKFPLNIFTVVTGVSGSGKSSLVHDVFYAALKRCYGGVVEKAGSFGNLRGSLHLAKDVEFVDQNPIGRSSRSNPVTYVKAYDEIRKLFAEQPLAKQLGFTAAHFSFNVDGGRCEECQGEGVITVEMQFMADIELVCDCCHGKRFKSDVLEVKYRDKNIFDVLDMTVNQAIEFFGEDAKNKTILKKLKPLQDVGLGYVKLGQSSATLSGGESQRVKLALFLSQEKAEPSIFIFDEPTTGLHFHDIKTLMKAFDALILKGHTVIVIEHNMDVIKCADHIIDLGPEGGKEGGHIVFEGTPEEIVKCEKSYTGQFLKAKM
ncbi:MAG: excinuclease ABC subunit UvrA [Prevotellaceae bacterium]|nr:excinuclease ABC subunit UvrA [Prevotellaceae bacterium]